MNARTADFLKTNKNSYSAGFSFAKLKTVKLYNVILIEKNIVNEYTKMLNK